MMVKRILLLLAIMAKNQKPMLHTTTQINGVFDPTIYSQLRKEKSSAQKSSHRDNMQRERKREKKKKHYIWTKCVWKHKHNDIQLFSFHSGCNNREHVLLELCAGVVFSFNIGMKFFRHTYRIGIHLVNFILCLFVTRQSQNINTDNIRLLFIFYSLLLSLDYQNVVNCTVYDKWYILDV